jgi:hypothetical protein
MKFDKIIITKFKKDRAYIDFMYNNKTEYLTLNLYSHLKLSPKIFMCYNDKSELYIKQPNITTKPLY